MNFIGQLGTRVSALGSILLGSLGTAIIPHGGAAVSDALLGSASTAIIAQTAATVADALVGAVVGSDE